MRRVLIDECINPRLTSRLRSALPGHTVETVRDLGLAGVRDNVLVFKIQHRFDVFLTLDRGFEFEHNFERLSFGVIVLRTANNQMPSYERILTKLIECVQTIAPGQFVRVTDPER